MITVFESFDVLRWDNCFNFHILDEINIFTLVYFDDINIFNDNEGPNFHTDMYDLEQQGYVRVWTKHHLIKIDKINLY